MHHNIYWWIAAVCAVAAAVILYLQVAFGDSDKPIREHINQIISVIKGDWRQLPAFAVKSTDELFSRVFGKRIMSVRYVASMVIIGLLLNLIAYHISISRMIMPGHPVPLIATPRDLPLLLVNTLIDGIFLLIGRAYLRWSLGKGSSCRAVQR